MFNNEILKSPSTGEIPGNILSKSIFELSKSSDGKEFEEIEEIEP